MNTEADKTTCKTKKQLLEIYNDSKSILAKPLKFQRIHILEMKPIPLDPWNSQSPHDQQATVF